jgi:hypothetical protein
LHLNPPQRMDFLALGLAMLSSPRLNVSALDFQRGCWN